MPYFLINGPSDKPTTPRKRKGPSMAAKRRRRRKNPATARRKPVARRRRKARANPHRRVAVAKHRRRRRAVARVNPRRRHYRRNPPGIAGVIMEGAQDGLAVVAGQVITRKLATGVAAMIPAPTSASIQKVQYIGLRLAASIGVAIAAKKFAPKWARMMTAGAFAETINAGLAQTPIAPYLAAIPQRRSVALMPGQRQPSRFASGTGAYPTMIPARTGVGAYARRMPTSVGNQ